MRYFGGKQRIGKELATFIQDNYDFSVYWEPFCGMCSVMEHISPDIFRIGSDLHKDLIVLWEALSEGWQPPETLSEEKYNALKGAQPCALKTFAGFGCSNSGKWFGGYARDKTGRNYAKNARNSLLRKIGRLQNVWFLCGAYDGVHVPGVGKLIYCDPPYSDTTGFSLGKFDSDKFWQWVREKSRDNTVLVSEYVAPDDFEVVWQKQVKTDMKKSDNTKFKRVEKLFKLK